MGLRYRKRINLGNGHGLNVSGSGVSYSKRTSWGSVGSRGFSFRTGIPGLYFYQPWGKFGKRGKNSAGYFLLFVLLFFVVVAAIQVLIWIFRFIFWLFERGIDKLNQYSLQQKAIKAYKQWGSAPEYTFFKFDEASLPPGMGKKSVVIESLLFPDGAKILQGQDICTVYFDEKYQATIPSLRSGILKWYVRPGDALDKDDFVFHIHEPG